MPLTPQNKRRLRFTLWLLGAVGLYLAGCFFIAVRLVFPEREMAPLPQGFTARRLSDGTTIWCKMPTRQTQPVVFVLAHGFRGKITQWVPTMNDLSKQGFPSITMAMPGHDDSPYENVGFGPTEADVIIRTAHWARQSYPGSKIVLVGVSLGGAACWLAVSRDPACADGVVTESAFAQLDGAVHNWLTRGLGAVGPILLSPVRAMAASMAKVSVDGINPIEGARRWRGKPASIIHATDDPTVLPLNGTMLAEALGTRVVEIRAGHACCYKGDPARFSSELLRVALEVSTNR